MVTSLCKQSGPQLEHNEVVRVEGLLPPELSIEGPLRFEVLDAERDLFASGAWSASMGSFLTRLLDK